MGLVRPEDYCQDDPYLASPCYFNGDPLLAGSGSGAANVLRSIPIYCSGSKSGIAEPPGNRRADWPDLGVGLPAQQPDVVDRSANEAPCRIWPLGTGGIYSLEINPANGQVVSGPTSFLDLNTLIPTEDIIVGDPHSGLPAASGTPNTDPNSWDWVGKMSIGDMDMSGDDERLWVMNLFDQTLYSLNVGIPAAAPPTSVVGYSIVAAMGSARVGDIDAASCVAANDVRPWAVEVHEGYVYVGVVCSAQSYSVPSQSVQAVDAMRAYILRRPDNDNPAPGFNSFINSIWITRVPLPVQATPSPPAGGHGSAP